MTDFMFFVVRQMLLGPKCALMFDCKTVQMYLFNLNNKIVCPDNTNFIKYACETEGNSSAV